MVDEADAQRMLRVFEGYHDAYGSYDPTAKGKKDGDSIRSGKVEIKATAFTRRKAVTIELWLDHLNGKTPLGIIPIRADNTCMWGCIDVDEYGVDIFALYRRLKKEDITNVIICGSKSKGAHIFMPFSGSGVEAGELQFTLQQAAALIGRGSSEIFPKQRSVALERGDLGSWLNMPYFGDARWAYREPVDVLDDRGNIIKAEPFNPDDPTIRLPLKEFLTKIEGLRQTVDALDEKEAAREQGRSTGHIDFADGPPCLQHLSDIGVYQGGRNEGLMAFGVFAKKKYPNDWEGHLERWNHTFFKPALPAEEVADIIKRLRQKDYYYPCKKQPIVAHCQSALCRTRKYGVASGSTDSLPVIGGLSVLPTDPPLWFVDVGEHRVELTTEQLINYSHFRLVCANKFHAYFDSMKQDAWGMVVGHAMREVNKIEISEEVGLGGQFVEILDDFVNNQHRGQHRDEIALGRPWFNDAEQKHYFRMKDLAKFLNDANFKTYSRAHVATRIRALSGDNGQLMLSNGKNVRVWWVPAAFIPKPMPTTAPAAVEGDPI
jgi:hypothetical protein